MALKKSTVLWAVPGDREEETEVRKRAYGNYLKNRSSSGPTNLQGTASTGFLGGGQKAGRPSLTSSADPPWELKDLGKEMQKFQNTQQTPAAEQTTSLPAVPQLSAGWEQEQSQGLLELGREIGANISRAADHYQNEMKPIMDQAGAAIYSESGMTPGVEAFLSPYEVSGERSYETLMYPMLAQLETQRDALWNSGVEFLLDLPEKLSTPWGMPSEDMIDNGF
ncbi:hypothetical protein H8S23_13710 [Anaerofilum sp. BX8]|uniref:Uncharacterized protein n=1 Tax=Anaerofilum hominis TaxID=2763016 RepID=A0A923L2B7_9FIRM|nr:hypothetical protein [Anaerofilum hominis]MBC5582564.1 hypothetical protein [Anaerofilum hominis]